MSSFPVLWACEGDYETRHLIPPSDMHLVFRVFKVSGIWVLGLLGFFFISQQILIRFWISGNGILSFQVFELMGFQI